MYRELRDELELYERARRETTWKKRSEKSEEAVLCKFYRNEKESDIRLRIRLLKLEAHSADRDVKERKQQLYRKEILDFLKEKGSDFEKIKDAKKLCYLLSGNEQLTVKEAAIYGSKFSGLRRLKDLDEASDIILQSYEDSKRNDSYILMKQSYLDYRLGNSDRRDYFKTAEIICKNRKFPICKDAKKLIKEIVLEKKSVNLLSEEEMGLLTEELLAAILVAQARAFLYDAGYALDSKGDEATEKYAVKTAKRRQDHMLDLVDIYWKKAGRSTRNDSDDLVADCDSDEFKEHCLAIFEKLQNEKNDTICLPLCIDPWTGTGLFIMGINHLDEKALTEWCEYMERDEDDWECFHCHFTCIYWEDLFMQDFESIDFNGGVQIFGDDIYQAVEAFCEMIVNDKYAQGYEMYRGMNGDYPGKFAEKFKRYFEYINEDVERFREEKKQEIERAKATGGLKYSNSIFGD